MATVFRMGKTPAAEQGFQIEKNVPLPPRGGPGRPYIYPFRDMEVGDSFLVPCGDNERDREKTHRRLTGAWKAVQGRKFTARRIVGEGVRVWRIA